MTAAKESVTLAGVTLDVSWECYDPNKAGGAGWVALDNSTGFTHIALTNDHGNCYVRNAAGTPVLVEPQSTYYRGVFVKATILAKTSGSDVSLAGMDGQYAVTVNKASRIKTIDEANQNNTTLPAKEDDDAVSPSNPYKDESVTWNLQITNGAFASGSTHVFIVAIDGTDTGTADSDPVSGSIYLTCGA